jgi:hypothetical protein
MKFSPFFLLSSLSLSLSSCILSLSVSLKLG